MKNVSIKWRMTLWFTLFMVVITVLMLVFVMLMNRNTVTRPPEAEVIHMVERNAKDIKFDDGTWNFKHVDIYAHGVYTEIFDENGRRLAGATPAVLELSAPSDTSNATELAVVSGSDDEDYYVYDMLLETEHGDLWVRGTISENAQSGVMAVIVPLAWALLPALVVLSALGGWLISTLSFRPMKKVIASAEAISGGEDLSLRIGLPRGKSEINRLAAAFDDMFDRLERSFEAEVAFTSNASHELRTPVAVIAAQCETLQRDTPTVEEYAEGINVINQQAEEIKVLIDQLLQITRLEQGTQKISLEPADLGEMAEIVCSRQRLVAPEGTVLECKTESVSVLMDVALITGLMNNLITNAFRYGRKNGHVCVEVYGDGESAVLSVSDDGIGIAEDDLQRIWQRFYQADSSRGSGEGAGLGLYIVKQTAQLHGGSVEVKSTLGKGSTFTVRLPLK